MARPSSFSHQRSELLQSRGLNADTVDAADAVTSSRKTRVVMSSRQNSHRRVVLPKSMHRYGHQ